MPLSINNSMSWNAASAAEILSVMLQKEQTVYRSRDYLANPSSSRQVIDEGDRTKMVDWCYRIVDTCQLEREIVAIAMEMVDRFLSKPSKVSEGVLRDRIQFQLLTLTSLYVAIKSNEKTALGSDFFSHISGELYTAKEIESMERTLLNELSWCISAPTCVQMAHHILSLLSSHLTFDKMSQDAIFDEVMFQTEHAVRDFFFVTQRPSTVALAAIFNSLDIFDKRDGQAIIQALLSVMNEEIDSLEIILTTKSKLFCLVYGHKEVNGDNIAVVQF